MKHPLATVATAAVSVFIGLSATPARGDTFRGLPQQPFAAAVSKRPHLTISSQVLQWTPVPGGTVYLLSENPAAPGTPATRVEVEGLEAEALVVPNETVSYHVREIEPARSHVSNTVRVSWGSEQPAEETQQEREAEEQAQHEREAKEAAEREAKEAAEREAREQVQHERELKELHEREAKEAAEKAQVEAEEQHEREAIEKANHELEVEEQHEREAAEAGGIVPGLDIHRGAVYYDALAKAGAKAARDEFGLSESNLVANIKAEATEVEKRGAKLEPLLGFSGGHPSEAQFAAAGEACKANPEIIACEDGNETSFSYQYGDSYSAASYKERARWYAKGCKTMAEKAAPVGVICQAEDGGSGSPNWVNEMFAAVPNLSSYVKGWVIHPYTNQTSISTTDTSGIPKMERMVRFLGEHGNTKTPIYVTEWGVPSENGRTLSDGKHFTFQEAGEVVERHVPALIKASKEHGVRTFIVYQDFDQRAQGTDNEREHYFGAFTSSGGNKGFYTTAIERFMRGEAL